MAAKQSILIVDDTEKNLLLLEALLSELDVDIVKAKSGMEALQLLDKSVVSLAFLDVQMPQMNGFELAQHIRKNPMTRYLPIIFVTAVHFDESFINKGYDVGAIDFILKPINPTVLLSKAKVFMELDQQKKMVEAQRNEIQKQKEIISNKNKDIVDSLIYAARIQTTIMPRINVFKKYLPDSFIFSQPRDIVSGDFYWIKKRFKQLYVACVDCTGHGVPGALLSIIGLYELNHAVEQYTRPHDILNYLNKRIFESLHFNSTVEMALDGLDIALCMIDYDEMVLEFSGAFLPMLYFKEGKLFEFPSNKLTIGSTPDDLPVVGHITDIEEGDTFYLFSDGYLDQFGGPNGKKFKYAQFKELLSKINQLPLDDQAVEIESVFQNWKGTQEQVDDILVLGFKA